MGHSAERWRLTCSAIFTLAILLIAGLGILQLAMRRWQVQPTFHVRARFDAIGGLEAGGRVRIQGIEAGAIERVIPPPQPGEPVELVLRVDKRMHYLIRADATAKIVSQGFVGLKIVEIIPGRSSAPQIEELGLIRSQTSTDLTDLMARARESLEHLDKSVVEAEKGISQVRSIVDAVGRGEGSLGKLIRDEKLVTDLASLSQRGERTLSALQENLDALKHTWPISRYFNDRAYFDRDRILYQPGSSRATRSISVDDTFEPGRSVLTDRGKKQLDEVGRWLQVVSHSSSEVVIAAFTDQTVNEDKSRILTQEQADAVRAYLIRNYSIDSLGWFRGRKVAAVGFGSHLPQIIEDGEPRVQPSPRRVDVIVFTPQT